MRLVAAVALTTLACGGERVVEVRDWRVEGRAVTLPAKVATAAPRIELHADVPLGELRGHTLTLAIPQVEARTTLLLSNQALEPLDDPGPGWRGDRAPRWRIPSERTNVPSLPLTLVVDNSAPQSSRLSTVPRLSATPFGDTRFKATKLFNHVSSAIAFGALIGMFATYAVLWILDRKRRSHWHLALAALLSTTSPLLWLDATQYAFGRLELVVVAVALALAGFSILESYHEHFELPPPPRATWGVGALLVAMTVLSTVAPSLAALTGILALLSNYTVILWGFVLLAGPARRSKRAADAYPMGLALLALFVSTAPTALWRFGVDHPLAGVVLTPLGMMLFLLIHSVTLSRAYVATTVELDARVDQLGVLNLELRRQVADRSQKLAEALARIEGVTSVQRAFAEGDLVDGRYKVIRGIGAGGMGAVYEVERLSDQKHFALKVLRGETSGHALSRFAREAEIAARIDHPNLVAVIDVDVAESGSLYIVMELVEGTSLENARLRFGDAKWARPIIAQIAEGLAALHREHVIHRDLKPGNVLIDKQQRVKIADFGISALREVVDPLGATHTPDAPRSDSLTQTGAMLGTPMYMAPELWRGADRANEASDVFSLGLVAYLLLADRYPFAGPPIYDVGAGRTVAEPEPIKDAIVLRCLSFDPSKRPSAAEVASALRAS